MPRRRRRRPVQPLVQETAQLGVVRDDVEHADHLAEDQHAVARLLQARQQFVEQDHLARGQDEPVGLLALRSLTCARTQVCDLSPLSSCTALQVLSVEDSEVSDVAPLLACTALAELKRKGCRLVGLQALLLRCPGLRLFPAMDSSVDPSGAEGGPC